MKVEAENVIKAFTEKIANKHQVISLEEYDQLEQRLYECSFQIKRDILGNRCYIILNKDKTVGLSLGLPFHLESYDAWREILPIIRINDGFIDRKGLKALEYVIFIVSAIS